ncbi:hypothetical protein T06_14840, partial [Trichinella sp. T6]
LTKRIEKTWFIRIYSNFERNVSQLHRAIEISVSTNHVWRERKETTRVNFRRNAKRHTAT